MNKTNQLRQKFSWPITISVTFDGAPLLKNMVEKLAYCRDDRGFSKEAMPEGWQALDATTIEAYVGGCIAIEELDEYVALSYTTCFSFTCTKAVGGNNRLCWVNSLS